MSISSLLGRKSPSVNVTDSVLLNSGVDRETLRAALHRYVASVLASPRRILFVGRSEFLDELLRDLGAASKIARRPLEASLDVAAAGFDEAVIVEEAPDAETWPLIAVLAAKPNVRLLWEAMREELLLAFLASKLPYLVNPLQLLEVLRSVPGTSPTRIDQPIAAADAIVPFRGKRVIEFGPLDGAQTSAIIKLGAAEITCVEIRPDNYVKTLLTADLLGAHNVTLRFDNFHAVTRERYGAFDICVAHGVYYHSNAPFTLLENIASLAPVIVFGGYCATDDVPGSEWTELHYEGRAYRAKAYSEAAYFTAGVSSRSYFFAADSIQAWFTERGFELLGAEVRDVRSHKHAGEFVYFVARRKGG